MLVGIVRWLPAPVCVGGLWFCPKVTFFLIKRVILDIGEDFHQEGSQGNEGTWRRDRRERGKGLACRARSISRRTRLCLRCRRAIETKREIEDKEFPNHERLYGSCQEGPAAAAGSLSVPPGSQERPQLVGTQRNLLCRGKNIHMRHSEARKEQESIQWVFSDIVMWSRILDFLHILASWECLCAFWSFKP